MYVCVCNAVSLFKLSLHEQSKVGPQPTKTKTISCLSNWPIHSQRFAATIGPEQYACLRRELLIIIPRPCPSGNVPLSGLKSFSPILNLCAVTKTANGGHTSVGLFFSGGSKGIIQQQLKWSAWTRLSKDFHVYRCRFVCSPTPKYSRGGGKGEEMARLVQGPSVTTDPVRSITPRRHWSVLFSL